MIKEINNLWSVKMTDTVMKLYPDLSDKWSHEYGVIFKGIEDVWLKTKENKYFDYIRRNIEPRVEEDGSIRGYEIEDYSLDHINTGRMFFNLYSQTGDIRYKKAAEILREQFKTHPRTSEGGFWHKKEFHYQMWIDGIYMGEPFYAEFAKVFNDLEAFDDIANQIILASKHAQDDKTGLLYHGWDEKREQIWANADTGCSSNFWGRAMGWYSMGIVDVLDYMPENHEKREKLIEILRKLMTGIVNYQDNSTGLWYQVIDKGNKEGNYLEASCSCMFTYTLAKGIRKGYLDESFVDHVNKAYKGILNEFIEVDEDGNVNINGTCKTAGLGVHANRDGSFAYYISEPIAVNDFKGIGTFIMASVQVELIQE